MRHYVICTRTLVIKVIVSLITMVSVTSLMPADCVESSHVCQLCYKWLTYSIDDINYNIKIYSN